MKLAKLVNLIRDKFPFGHDVHHYKYRFKKGLVGVIYVKFLENVFFTNYKNTKGVFC